MEDIKRTRNEKAKSAMSSLKTLNANAEVMGAQAVRICPYVIFVRRSRGEISRKTRVTLAVTR